MRTRPHASPANDAGRIVAFDPTGALPPESRNRSIFFDPLRTCRSTTEKTSACPPFATTLHAPAPPPNYMTLTPAEFNARIAQLGVADSVDKTTIIKHVEALLDSRPEDPDLRALLATAFDLAQASDTLDVAPYGLHREKLIGWDRWSTTWLGHNTATGQVEPSSDTSTQLPNTSDRASGIGARCAPPVPRVAKSSDAPRCLVCMFGRDASDREPPGALCLADCRTQPVDGAQRGLAPRSDAYRAPWTERVGHLVPHTRTTTHYLERVGRAHPVAQCRIRP